MKRIHGNEDFFSLRQRASHPTPRRKLLNRAAAAVTEALESRILLSAEYAGQFYKYSTPTDVHAPVVQDLNNDGHPDLIVATGANDNVSVHLGSGGANFALKSNYPTPGSANGITVADFNGDGKPDLAIAVGGANVAEVAFGNGDGTFQPATSYAVGANPVWISTADVTGDGKLDLITANSTGNSVTVLRGLGDGTFALSATIPLAYSPYSLNTADLNTDGVQDIVVTSVSSPIIDLLLSNGSGGFNLSSVSAGSGGHFNCALTDLNHDNKIDLVTSSDKVNVRLGNGNGTFGPETDMVYSDPVSVEPGNFDADGNTDINVENVGILPGKGDGTFGQASGELVIGYYPFTSPGGFGRDVAIADLNGDGLSDTIEPHDSGSLEIVIDEPLVPQPDRTPNVTSYKSVGATVAKFLDSLDRPASSFTATIVWGDGFTTSGTIVPDPSNVPGQLMVTGTHNYPNNGTYNITVTINDDRNNSITQANQAFVQDAPPPPVMVDEFSAGLGGWPGVMVPGPSGKIWFSHLRSTQDNDTDSLGLLGTDGSVALYPIATTAAESIPLASDSAGNAWFVEPGLQLGRMDASGNTSSFSLPGPAFTLARGPDGNVWFLVSSTDGTKSLDLASVTSGGTFSVAPLDSTIGGAGAMTLGPDGNFWVTLPSPGGASPISSIARITPTGHVTQFPLDSDYNPSVDPFAITAGPDGNVWFTEPTGNRIGRVTPSGVATTFAVPTNGSPLSIIAGTDGAVWFTDRYGNGVGRITTAGAVQEVKAPTHVSAMPGNSSSGTSLPYGIAAGADGNIWFTEMGADIIGRVNLSRLVMIAPGTPSITPSTKTASGTFATFVDPQGGYTAGNYTATINWGDNTSSPGAVVASGNGFAVTGSHAYSGENRYPVVVTVQRPGDTAVDTVTTAMIDYPLTLSATNNIRTTEGASGGTTTLATFTDPDFSATASQYYVVIDWGDGTTSTVKAVAGSAAGTFNVNGSHTYAEHGKYTINTTIQDYGADLVATSTAFVVDTTQFLPAVQYTSPITLGGIVSGDFNGDGAIDLLSVYQNTVVAYPNNGFGVFGQPVTTTLKGPINIYGLATADFNHDGKSDLALSYQDPNTGDYRLDILLSDAKGGFQPFAHYIASAIGQILVTDLNKDNIPDLVVSDTQLSVLTVLLGHGDGTFSAMSMPVGTSGHAGLGAEDFNGDGNRDLVVTDLDTSQISVLFGNGDGTFAAPVDYSFGTGLKRFDLVTGDFNGDQKPDVAVADGYNNTLGVFLNNGSGVFRPVITDQLNPSIPVGVQRPEPNLRTADVNGDGTLDLVFADWSNSVVDVRPGVGDGTFLPDLQFSDLNAAQVTLADLNGDGRIDIAGTQYLGNGSVGVLINTPLNLKPANVSVAEGQSSRVTLATLADVDDIGTPVTAGSFTATIDWGDGTSGAGTVAANSSGGFDISGVHPFHGVGVHSLKITVLGPGGTKAVLTENVTVTDAPLAITMNTVNPVAGVQFTAAIANFTDADPTAISANYSAVVNWADGSTSSATIAARSGGGWQIYGTHTYASSGSWLISVTVTDNGGASASGSKSATVSKPNVAFGQISGTVYNDANLDGNREVGESGVYLSTVFVDTNGDGTLNSGEISAVTAPDGTYTLSNVPAGTWSIRQLPPPGYVQTAPAGAAARSITLTAGQVVPGIDFGDAQRSALILSGSSGDDTFNLKLNPDGTDLDIWQTLSGAPATYRKVPLAAIWSIAVDGGSGGVDLLTVDNSLGLVTSPGMSFSFTGGGAGTTLSVIGTPAANTVSINATSGQVVCDNTSISAANVNAIIYGDGGGNDAITIAGTVPVTVNTGTSNDAIGLDGSAAVSIDTTGSGGGIQTLTIGSGANPILTVNASSGIVNLAVNSGAGIRQVNFSRLNIASGAKMAIAQSSATLGDYSNHANRTVAVIDAGGLNIATGGILDLGDNDLILHYASANETAARNLVSGLLASGFDGGGFDTAGINSSAASYDAYFGSGTRALGWMDNNDIGATSFDGVNTSDLNEVMVKFTYYGDSDLNGVVDATDFGLYAAGKSNAGTGWAFGNYDYNATTTDATDFGLFAAGLQGYRQFGAL